MIEDTINITLCDCIIPGGGNGSRCRSEKYNLKHTSDDWCNCKCHNERFIIVTDYDITHLRINANVVYSGSSTDMVKRLNDSGYITEMEFSSLNVITIVGKNVK